MEENVKTILGKINWSSLVISACAQSLDYIQKDLEELEISANDFNDSRFLGLTNIVEQLTYVIKSEADKITEFAK